MTMRGIFIISSLISKEAADIKSKKSVFLSWVLVFSLLLSLSVPAYASNCVANDSLRFNKDGTFTILQFTDTQDTQWPSPNMLTMLQKCLDESKPDLVVFTGDQLKNYDSDFGDSGHEWKAKKALYENIKPVVARDIPFVVAFGNHDSLLSFTLEQQVRYLQKFKGCLLVDEGPEISGCGNYNIPILGSSDNKTAFNLYFLDSNQSQVLPDQIDWYVAKSNELKALNEGVPVPSIEFQHIVPHDSLVSTFAAQGDVIASFFGHNHYRSDTINRFGIDLVYTPTVGFYEVGPGMERGARVITLHENEPSRYDTHVLTFVGLLGDNPITDCRYTLFTLHEIEWDNPVGVLTVLFKIAKALCYLRHTADGDLLYITKALLEFFGVDVNLPVCR